MKTRNAVIFCLIMMLSMALSTCSWENPVIEKWWTNEDEDYNYKAIIKDVPHLIYETIIQEKVIYDTIIAEIPVIVTEYETIYVDRPLPPEILLQHIDIIGIEFIIFSGDQTEYNYPAAGVATSNLTEKEQERNNEIVVQMVDDLSTHNKDGDKYFLILHGHANPISHSQEESDELAKISNARAEAVRDAIEWKSHKHELPEYDFIGPNYPGTPFPEIDTSLLTPYDFADRITTRGYGGGRNISSPSSTYAGLNRRVEAILFTVTEEAKAPGTLRTGTER